MCCLWSPIQFDFNRKTRFKKAKERFGQNWNLGKLSKITRPIGLIDVIEQEFFSPSIVLNQCTSIICPTISFNSPKIEQDQTGIAKHDEILPLLLRHCAMVKFTS